MGLAGNHWGICILGSIGRLKMKWFATCRDQLDEGDATRFRAARNDSVELRKIFVTDSLQKFNRHNPAKPKLFFKQSSSGERL